MKSTFKNWWTNKWFTANNKDTARFKRGYIYSLEGRVYKIKYNRKSLTAKVRGNYSRFYNVKLNFKQLSDVEKQEIIDIIKNDYNILSSILNNKIPEEFYKKLNNVGIFDKYINANCNCPDIGNPCKHEAALIYTLGYEIDKNPFLLFKIHGFDLASEFEILQNKEIINVNEFFKNDEKEYGKSSQNKVALDKITNMSNKTIFMLEDDPVFYERNFREILSKLYKNLKTFSNNFFKSVWSGEEYYDFIDADYYSYEKTNDFNETFNNKWLNPNKWDDFTIDIKDDFRIYKINTNCKNPFNSFNEKLLVGFLSELDYASDITQYHEKIQFIYKLFKFTIVLIKNSAITPHLFKTDDRHIIQWLPANYDKNIQEVLEQLYKLTPVKIATFNGNDISEKQQVQSIISILIKGMLDFYIESGMSKELQKNIGEPVFDLFLGSKVWFNKNYKDYEFLINQWITCFSNKNRDYNLFLEVEGDLNKFTIDLKEENNRVYDIIRNQDKNYQEIITDIHIIKQFLPEIERIIKTGDVLYYNLEEFRNILTNTIPILETMGISVILPKELKRLTEPQLKIKYIKPTSSRKTYISEDDFKNFDWEISIGNYKISKDEFEKQVKKSKGIVRIANNYIILDEKEVKSFLKKLSRLSDNPTPYDLIQAVLTGELESFEVNIDDELKDIFKNMIKHEDIPIPKNFNGKLRDYQKIGYSWLVQNINNGFGSILADDMGLGKTIQTLATIQHFKQKGLLKGQKVLIVMPAGLLLNWEREIERFTPNLKSFIYHGPQRELPKTGFDILLTSYGVLRSDKEKINKKRWFLIVIDEAQNIKNPLTKQSKAIKSIKSKNKIALSGTPVENRLIEYWSIFDFTNKHYLPSIKSFSEEYITPIENNRDETVLNKFKAITEPFILRRVKTDKNIIDDLPEKIVNDVYCNLTTKQAAIYQETLDSLMNNIHQ
ncbi:MAG: DEAD/DEAH box helicase family protein, partial [Methanobrevibacter sp.]|nr:DEAD/DEAH box helicase family protein [Methanobrevibacter sp.]